MRTFLITLMVSTVATVALWQFGMANLVWPEHPFVSTVGIAATCGIATQLLLTHNLVLETPPEPAKRARSTPQ
jgi:hypothetical protein